MDIDIAFGYETLDTKTVQEDANVKAVLNQIKTKYSSAIRSYNLETV